MKSMRFLTGSHHMNDLIAIKFIKHQLDVPFKSPTLGQHIILNLNLYYRPGKAATNPRLARAVPSELMLLRTEQSHKPHRRS